MAFVKGSRYERQATRAYETDDGSFQVVTLRRTPLTDGVRYDVKPGGRMDRLSLERYEDPTRFWHIADANTELEASDLIETPRPTILLPES